MNTSSPRSPETFGIWLPKEFKLANFWDSKLGYLNQADLREANLDQAHLGAADPNRDGPRRGVLQRGGLH
jgi:hypothetical protein